MKKQNNKHDPSSNCETNSTPNSPLQRGGSEADGVLNSPLTEGWQTKSDGVLDSPLQRSSSDSIGDKVLNSPSKADGKFSCKVFTTPTKKKSSGMFQNYKKLPYNPKLKERARKLRKAGNLSEVLFWKQVKRKKFLGLDFHRQKIIGNYIVDFYCPALQLVVEIDGSSHNDKIEYDKARDEYLKSLNLKIVHYSDRDIKKNLNSVIENLKEICRRLMNNLSSGKPKSTPL